MQPSPSHILHGLYEICARDPQRTLFVFVDEMGREVEHRSAAQLVERIERLANYLVEGCGLQRGDVALLIYPPSMEFVEAYAACLLAGIIAAPVYPPNVARPQNDLLRLNKVAQQSKAKAMLTNRAYRWAARMSSAKDMFSGSNARWPELPWYVTQGLSWFGSRKLQAYEAQADDVAILQFTSGSTSIPKGVRITHRNLMHQLDLNADLLGIEEDSRLAMWVPQYHDLGLISGITAVLRGRGCLWFMSPLAFLKRPAAWFDMLHNVRATHTASPNFGYELAVRKTTPEQRKNWDLRSLKVFMNAAEPIVPESMDNFMREFAASKLDAAAFCPAYGLAEHAVGVTIYGRGRIRIDRATLVERRYARIDDAHGELELFACGSPRADVKLAIVAHGENQALPERNAGEIWVQSDSVADGYEGQPELSREFFQAQLQGHTGYWLRTGDIGFMHEGQLYITGRLKDLVIIRGRNMHPEDIEESVRRCHPGIRAGGVVAFAVPGQGTEDLVLLAEVNDPEHDNLDEILQTLKYRIGEVWQLQATVGLVAPKTLRKTTSGKIQRAANRQAYLGQQFELLQVNQVRLADSHLALADLDVRATLRDLPLEDRLGWMVEFVRQHAQSKMSGDLSGFGARDFLPDAGLDSVAAAEILMSLEERLQAGLNNSLFVQHPTLGGAAARILESLQIEFMGEEAPIEAETAMDFRPAHRSMAPASTRVAMVGGGVGALVAALEMARCGYRDITIFEADSEVGGKVLTHTTADGEHIELGQNVMTDTYDLIMELAHELGCPVENMESVLRFWDEEYGFEEPPLRRTARPWFQNFLKAGRLQANLRLPFPSMIDPAHDISMLDFMKTQRLRSPHPMYYIDWNAMGYGLDHSISAAYTLAYFDVIGLLGNICYFKDGNRSLWRKLAQHLEQDWGVKILRNTRVEQVRGGAAHAELRVQGEWREFDEILLDLPPDQLQGVLHPDEAFAPYLDRFQYFGYVVYGFRATGLLQEGMVVYPHHMSSLGKTLLLQSCHQHKGWYIACMFSADAGGANLQWLDEAAMREELRAQVQRMGGEITEFGVYRHWTYFPHLRENVVNTMREIEGLQGQRHLWATGSWLSFETIEHVARHARHLVRTCFDPSFAMQD
ncbi:AMP-binding protein [Massilia sp. W12]|uniref:AMP-binding protein n=1 Tax=Massilia sp. W12 TaxID=3126507 RepID=UPI0030D191F2